MRVWSKVMLLGCLAFFSAAGAAAQVPQKDYLSPQEADKIRDAETGNEKIKLFVTFADDRLKEFLEALKKIKADGKEAEIYQDNLDDALEGTQDALNDAEKAKKSVAPPPVRRK